MKIKVKKATYSYKKPVEFWGEKYHNSAELAQAFINHWDLAVSAFRSGKFRFFWEEHVENDVHIIKENTRIFYELYYRMWELEENVDLNVVFSKAFHLIEPAERRIPYLGAGEDLVLFTGEDLGDIFRGISVVNTASCIIRKNFDSAWEEVFDGTYMGVRYLCQMLREKVFTCFGYIGAEEEFLQFLEVHSKEENPTNSISEEFEKIFRNVEVKLYARDAFMYQKTSCLELSEFTDLWKENIVGWNQKQWDVLIEKLLEENENAVSFKQWLTLLGEAALVEQLEVLSAKWSNRPKLPESMKTPEILSFWKYLKWGSKQVHEEMAEKLGLSQEDAYSKLKEQNKLPVVLACIEYYKEWNAFLGALQKKSAAVSDDGVIFKQLNEECSKWKQWEQDIAREYKNRKMLLEHVEKQDVLSLWNHSFEQEKFDISPVSEIKDLLILLAVTPIAETYQKALEDCLHFLKEVKPVTEVMGRYIQNIYNHILLDNAKELPDEVMEDYISFLRRMTEAIPGMGTLEDYVKLKKLENLVKDTLFDERKELQRINDPGEIVADVSLLSKIATRNQKNLESDYPEFFVSGVGKEWKEAGNALEVSHRLWKQEERGLGALQKELNEIHLDEKGYIAYKKRLEEKVQEVKAKIERLEKCQQDILFSFDKMKKLRDPMMEAVDGLGSKAVEMPETEQKNSKEADLNKSKSVKETKKSKQVKETKQSKEKPKAEKRVQSKRQGKYNKAVVLVAVFLGVFLLSGGVVNLLSWKAPIWKVEDGTLSLYSFTEGFYDNSVKEGGNIVDRMKNIIFEPAPIGFLLEGKEYIQGVKMHHSHLNFMEWVKVSGGNFEFPQEVDGQAVERIECELEYTTGGADMYEINRIVIPEGVTTIKMAFHSAGYCETGKGYQGFSIELPSTLKTIEKLYSDGVSKLDLKNVEEIDWLTCHNLTQLQAPKLKDVPRGFLYESKNLATIYLPAVETIDTEAFSQLHNMRMIYIGGNVQNIGENAFPRENANYEFCLDSGTEYSKEILNNLQSYHVPIVYEDFSALSF